MFLKILVTITYKEDILINEKFGSKKVNKLPNIRLYCYEKFINLLFKILKFLFNFKISFLISKY